jgi:hypothetical protein
MNDACDLCPVVEGICQGRRARGLCAWVDPSSPRFQPAGAAALVRMARGEPDPAGGIQDTPARAAEAQAAAAAAPAGIPLAGDLVEALARRVGADRLAAYVARKLGQPCNCPARQARLNALDRRFRRWVTHKQEISQ